MRIRVLINSVDLSSYVLESWDITDHDGDIMDSVSLELDDPSLVLDIQENQDLILERWDDATKRPFGGIITEVMVEPAGLGRVWHITAQDWKLILDRATVRKQYRNQTDLAIIQNAFIEAGITEIDTSSIQTIRTIDLITFTGWTLRQVLESISQITNGHWDITSFKILIYESEAYRSARYTFSDASTYVTELEEAPVNTILPYYNPTLIKDIGQFNSVEVVGGKKLSNDTTDTYSGDASRTFFNLRIDGTVAGREYHDIFREPTTANTPVIKKNTGTDGVPVWTNVGVRMGRPGDTTFPSGVGALFFSLTRQVLFETAPPNFANNAWQIIGRYWGNFYAIDKDDTLIAAMGREFKKTLVVPEIQSDDDAADVAAAFLRDQGPKTNFSMNIDYDGLEVGTLTAITCAALGLSALPLIVDTISYRLLGAVVVEYRVLLSS